MGCGLPACTTDVGEVRRVVSSGVNGEIVTDRTSAGVARAFARCIERRNVYRGAPAGAAVRAFVPGKRAVALLRELPQTRRTRARIVSAYRSDVVRSVL